MNQKSCMHCGSTAMRRINRRGFLEEKLFPKLGLYPWECAMCRRKTFLRDNGHSELKRKARDSAREHSFHEPDQGQSTPD